MGDGRIEEINAVTLAVADMAVSLAFYQSLRFAVLVGDADSVFTTLAAGRSFLNLQLEPGRVPPPNVWGRVIFWVDDVDVLHARLEEHGYVAEFPPSDAPWGERYFHVRDPDGHELSFARPI